MGTRTVTVLKNVKNPAYGQPGEPEMLPPQTFTYQIDTVQKIVSASGFQDACETGLGGGSTGAARFGKILRDMAGSIDDLVFSAFKRYEKSITFDKDKAAPLFSLLVSKGLMTAPERTAILAAWPEE